MSSGPKQPAAPNVQQTADSALAAELKYRPAFREQDVIDIDAFARAASDAQRKYGFDLARDEREFFEELEPETFALNRKLAEQTLQALENPLDAGTEAAYRERFRAEEALGGRLGSPIGSSTIATKLAGVAESKRENAANRALSFLGRTSLQSGEVPIQRGSEFGQFVTPYLNAATSIYGTQSNSATERRGQNMKFYGDVIGGGLGAAGSIGGAMIAGCWVAAEVFGGWSHPNTIWARLYLNLLAPQPVRSLYLRFGPTIAAIVRRVPVLKAVLRPFFMRWVRAGQLAFGS